MSMKFYGQSRQMLEGPPVFYQAQLKGTSSWANTFLGRDHRCVNVQRKLPTLQPKERKSRMSIQALSIIGESINDSVPSTKALFDASNLEGIVALATSQDEKGAAYIDVNVGR
jgi:hypothetical protein